MLGKVDQHSSLLHKTWRQGRYLQQLIFFITYEGAQSVRMQSLEKLERDRQISL
jgi:hypothetical protein